MADPRALLLALVCAGCPPSTDCLSVAEYGELTPVFRWRGSNEHLWTTDLRGEAAARSGYWSDGVSFYVSRSASPRFPVAIYRVQGPAGHIYTVDAAKRDALLGEGYSDEGVLGYLARTNLTGCVLPAVLRYVRPVDGLEFYTTNGAEDPAIKAQGFVPEGVAGYASAIGPRPTDHPYTVGIYYFGMWSPAAFQSIQGWPFGNPLFYGASRGTDWWMGVRDMHENNCTPGDPALATQCAANPSGPDCDFFTFCRLDWRTRKPAIGWYDNSSVAVIQQHIRQAQQNGISFFNFYWYYNHYTNHEDVNDGLDSFLASNTDMRFALSVCEHSGHLGIDASQAPSVAHLLATKYATRPNYLRTSSGSPIFYICDVAGIGSYANGPPAAGSLDPATLTLFLNTLRGEVHNATGQYPMISAWDPRVLSYVEARSCLQPTGPEGSYPNIVNNVVSWLDAQRVPGKPLLPCFMQNMDDRPRVGVIEHSGFTMVADQSPEAFALGLQNVKTWIDRQDDELSHILSIYAWNEWHEGGIVEPNARDGALYLNLISDAFQLPIGNDPCRVTGVCSTH